MFWTALTLSLFSAMVPAQAQQYKLVTNYTGNTFFDRWTFQNGIDANTTGNVLFQTREQAQQLGLIATNPAGNVIIKVDNKIDGTNDPTFGRPSVKILSQDGFEKGSLMILDAVHMPYGCSVWPAYWTQGIVWPDDGEIDIVENVNNAQNNRMALHTLNGCQHSAAGSVQETGQLIQPDCFNQTNGNTGCLLQDKSTQSYGAGFAQNGGGVFATLWDDQGIRIWFFPRQSIPGDVPTSNPNPSGWGTPTAFWSSQSCDFNKFFKRQTIIFDITICGNFAGLPQIFNPGCQGNCLDLVRNPSNYDNAFFEIKYMTLFSTSGGSPGANTTGGGSGSKTASAPGASQTGPGKNDAQSLEHFSGLFTILCIIGTLFIALSSMA